MSCNNLGKIIHKLSPLLRIAASIPQHMQYPLLVCSTENHFLNISHTTPFHLLHVHFPHSTPCNSSSTPHTNHLFVPQSGSPLAEWAVLDDVYRVQNTSRVYGLEVGCTVENSYKLLQCLNRRSYEELSTAPITVSGLYCCMYPIAFFHPLV